MPPSFRRIVFSFFRYDHKLNSFHYLHFQFILKIETKSNCDSLSVIISFRCLRHSPLICTIPYSFVCIYTTRWTKKKFSALNRLHHFVGAPVEIFPNRVDKHWSIHKKTHRVWCLVWCMRKCLFIFFVVPLDCFYKTEWILSSQHDTWQCRSILKCRVRFLFIFSSPFFIFHILNAFRFEATPCDVHCAGWNAMDAVAMCLGGCYFFSLQTLILISVQCALCIKQQTDIDTHTHTMTWHNCSFHPIL